MISTEAFNSIQKRLNPLQKRLNPIQERTHRPTRAKKKARSECDSLGIIQPGPIAKAHQSVTEALQSDTEAPQSNTGAHPPTD